MTPIRVVIEYSPTLYGLVVEDSERLGPKFVYEGAIYTRTESKPHYVLYRRANPLAPRTQ